MGLTKKQIDAQIKKGKSVLKMDYKNLRVMIKDKKNPTEWRVHYSGFATREAMENYFDFMMHNHKNYTGYTKGYLS